LSPSAVVQVPFCCLLLNNKKKAKFIYTEDNVFFFMRITFSSHGSALEYLHNTSEYLKKKNCESELGDEKTAVSILPVGQIMPQQTFFIVKQ